MLYEIQTKSDLSGAKLIVRFPEAELDRKAVYTLQADWPDFLVPFRYFLVDGQVECVYQLESRSKLQYRYGTRAPAEYVDFWVQILQPLMECGDWFLSPFSFVLDTRYLYVDKDGKRISYLYIPSRRECSEYDELRTMAGELSRNNPVTDPRLENKVLHAIMDGFQPKAFLQMLRESQAAPAAGDRPAAGPVLASPDAPRPVAGTPKVSSVQATPASGPAPAPAPRPAPAPTPAPAPAPAPKPAPPSTPVGAGDIQINFGGAVVTEPKKTKGGFLGGGKKEKEPKKEKDVTKKEPKKGGGLFGKKPSQPVIHPDFVPPPGPVRQLGVQQPPVQRPAAPQPGGPQFNPPAGAGGGMPWVPPVVESSSTQLFSDGGDSSQPRLRLTSGDPSLPREIPVTVQPGQAFTIGRFDVTVGRKQSSFEFEKNTKEISRHHAAIEMDSDGGYVLVDQASKAGTYVNGVRLTPNVPCKLTQGARVSFGTCGADYIWG